MVLDEPQGEKLASAGLLEGKADAEETKLLKHYHLVHIDASTKYGQKVAGVFRAKRFPHMAIIDKSGKVVLFKKSGKISTTEWNNALEPHQDGERAAGQARQLQAQRRLAATSSTPVYSNPSYCPSCQRNRR